MATLHPEHPAVEILPPPIGSLEDRERRLIEAVVALTRSLRDERDRLAARLHEVELELRRLTSRTETRGDESTDELSDFEIDARAARLRRPSRTSA
ncbi:MAG TPA: hypothetical protein VK548_29185 [Candidatus Acidoferrum sp.]|nr:hypothetical protein [Candidatus Acidoferrum sp.]